jgi:hypothetical protein
VLEAEQLRRMCIEEYLAEGPHFKKPANPDKEEAKLMVKPAVMPRLNWQKWKPGSGCTRNHGS